ncbi:uncharacterized protein PAC_12696 [Phialocephala subalpina]|uniref:Uncharacterized protein n=1 Tax=Phialocephala subalpina TaxID=576137 RepID=A0A1L7XCN6_9HELO|nr:uncharacterized protein PAC_12696 [Phialocephala subalpina]
MEKNEDRGLGLWTLYQPPDSNTIPLLDIVLVHGIDGHYVNTWKADDDEKTLWPTDLLPKHMPEVRVMSYSYRGTYNDAISTATTYEHGLDLLNWLGDLRTANYEEERPIIFVGHSLGGIIIKQALLAAKDYIGSTSHSDFRSRGRKIFESTYGVDWEQFVYSILENKKPDELRDVPFSSKIVQAISDNKDELVQISQKFRLLEKIAYVSFWEQFKTPKLEKVLVDKASATMSVENEEIRMLPKHHFQVCTFSKDDISFEQVLAVIGNIREKSPKAQESYKIADQVLKSLQVDELRANPQVFEQTKNTCDWFTKRRGCKYWQSPGCKKGKLWIVGELGCGKTYLARHIANKEIELGHTVAQCFLDQISESDRTCKTILLILLHDVLELFPHLINKLVVRVYYERRSEKNIWNLETMERVWPEVMLAAARIKPLTLIVDGLDRCEGDIGTLLKCFAVCEERLPNPIPLKMLVASRKSAAYYKLSKPYNFIISHIKERDTQEDIKATVQNCLESTVQERQYKPELRDLMYRKISKGARGMYLWARIMAEEVKLVPLSSGQLRSELHNLPKGIIELYDKILGRIGKHQKQREFVRMVLFWTTFRHKELRTEELRVGMAMSALKAAFSTTNINENTIKGFLPEYSISRTVTILCGHLVKIVDKKVNLVHESLKTFLITPNEAIQRKFPQVKVQHHVEYAFHEADSHKIICDFCVAYLLLDPFNDSGTPFDPEHPGPVRWEDKIRSRIRQHKFVAYAALNWITHAKLSGEEFSVKDNWVPSRRILLDLQNQQAICWTEVWWYIEKRHPVLPAYPYKDLRLEDYFGVQAGSVKSSILANGGNLQVLSHRRIAPSSPQGAMRWTDSSRDANILSPIPATNSHEKLTPLEDSAHGESESASTCDPQVKGGRVGSALDSQEYNTEDETLAGSWIEEKHSNKTEVKSQPRHATGIGAHNGAQVAKATPQTLSSGPSSSIKPAGPTSSKNNSLSSTDTSTNLSSTLSMKTSSTPSTSRLSGSTGAILKSNFPASRLRSAWSITTSTSSKSNASNTSSRVNSTTSTSVTTISHTQTATTTTAAVTVTATANINPGTSMVHGTYTAIVQKF